MPHPHPSLLALAVLLPLAPLQGAAPPDGTVCKAPIDSTPLGPELLSPDRWRPWQQGFTREGESFACDNGRDPRRQSGASQSVTLDQTIPLPILAEAWSRAEGVDGAPDSNYSLYLDLTYADGTPLWGQVATFDTGSHDWQRRRVTIIPDRPVRSVHLHLLLRGRAGRAWFKRPSLRAIAPDATSGFCLFDGQPARLLTPPHQGFLLRDAATNSPALAISRSALGLLLETRTSPLGHATLIDVTLRSPEPRDRAVTLFYTIPWPARNTLWLADPRNSRPVPKSGESSSTTPFPTVGAGRLSPYPFGAVSNPARDSGLALGLDPATPAFARSAYNSDSGELFLAVDLALAKEKSAASFRIVHFPFDPAWGFRSALARYHATFPDAFRCRTPRQGLWMPFDKISQVRGWRDFAFAFKEGDNETAWDDANGILTFRYTEPMTYWMKMPDGMPRTLDAALGELHRLAAKGDPKARAALVSGFHDPDGKPVARLLDTPWCDGAVWSMNSMPEIAGDPTDFTTKWNPQIRAALYGPARKADLDGEYIDSSEGYVTDPLDFRREHLAAAERPLVFGGSPPRPAIFRGLVAFEYIRAIARDIHADGKLMMANSTPVRLWWLAPLLEIVGQETDWNRAGRWSPMRVEDLLYRRAIAGPKPYCFLMNTDFDRFPRELVERTMRRCLAFAMFPGFFSADASSDRYFSRPELYERDRPLFLKYLPLCRRLAEAGWQPIPRARAEPPALVVERFGDDLLTVFNDSPRHVSGTITLDGIVATRCREAITGKTRVMVDGRIPIDLDPEDCALLELEHASPAPRTTP